MVGDPLDAGVRIDHIEAAAEFRKGAGCVEEAEFEFRIIALRGCDHVFRIVHAENVRAGETPRQHSGAVAGAAAEVQNPFRRSQLDPVGEIDCGLCPLRLKLQILFRIPLRHRTPPFPYFRLNI